jgi:hypothetical protein
MDYIKPLHLHSLICYIPAHRFVPIQASATSGEIPPRWNEALRETAKECRFHADVIEYIAAAASIVEGFMASQSVSSAGSTPGLAPASRRPRGDAAQ